MDELDLIKKDWQNITKNLPSYSKEELFPMIHKKSSSSVKWILIISILEFSFWIIVELLSFSQDYNSIIESIGFTWFLRLSSIVNYTVLIGFIIVFFRNYKRIQVNDSARQLMKQIIKTRSTVKYYVRYNIIFLAIIFIITSAKIILSQTELDPTELWIITGTMIFILLVILAFFLLLYRLLYGILTKRLYKNYKILSKIEV